MLRLYAATVRHVLPRGGLSARRFGSDDRLVFVVGSPRSGTTFLAQAIGALPGFVDFGEIAPLKASIPGLDAAGIRRIIDRIRRLALVSGLRGVEQTPEVSFVLAAALQAYPSARAIHAVRDGRDVVCSLLERGWLSAERAGRDDARLPYGSQARFWVEPERAEEFERVSDARRAAWAWRSYVQAAKSAPERTLEVRYEALAGEREHVTQTIGNHLDVPHEPVLANLAPAHAESVGRFRRDLRPEQLREVEDEAGPLLRELGYEF